MSSYLAHKRKGFQGAAPAAFNGFGNRSRNFNGSSDYVDLGDVLNTVLTGSTPTWTISTWLKTDSLDDGMFISKLNADTNDRQLFFRVLSTGEVSGIVYEGGTSNSIRYGRQTSTSGSITANTWHHVAISWDYTATGSYLRIWIDGAEATTLTDYFSNGASNGSIFSGNANLIFGTSDGTPITHWGGKIADMRIYDTDLTASEVSDLYSGTNITTNLVGHWLTDADDTEDKAGSNNGTNYGSKYSYDNPSPPVEFGRASRSFDGSSDYVNLGQTTDNAIFTASAWVKFNSHNSSLGEGIFGKWQTANDASWLIYTRPTPAGNFTFIVRNGIDNTNYICDSGIGITIGQWTHITGVADGTNLNIYVNGVSAASIAYDGTIHQNQSIDTNIGAYNNTINNQHFVDGKIADVRIYDTDLTASQVSDLYAGTDIQTNLVGHWLTNNDDVEDKAGANNGTNFGSTYDYDAPFTEVTLPNHFWNLSDTGTYADSGKLASAGWDLNEFSSVSSSVQSIGTSTKTVLDTISGGVLEYKNGANVDVGWDSESKEISMACWFYCDSINNSGNWLISWRGTGTSNKIAQIFVLNDGTGQIFRASVWDGQNDTALTPQSGTSISLNTWYHGAMTWDNTTLKTYVNGELFASATNALVDGFGTNTSGCEFAIGRGSWDKTNFGTHHEGYTFGAGVWDVALTENQIKALYNDGNALDYSDTTWR